MLVEGIIAADLAQDPQLIPDQGLGEGQGHGIAHMIGEGMTVERAITKIDIEE